MNAIMMHTQVNDPGMGGATRIRPAAYPTAAPIITTTARFIFPIITDRDCNPEALAYTSGMPKRSRKQNDPFRMARAVLDAVVPDAEPRKAAKPKNPAAIALDDLAK
jgi:hypothetical protein